MSQSTPATSAAAAAAAHERLSQLSNTTSIECRVCSETFISIEGLDEHVKIAHPPNVMRHPPVVYPPMSCEYLCSMIVSIFSRSCGLPYP